MGVGMARALHEVIQQQKAVERLTSMLGLIIQALAALLTVTFGYLEFQNAPLDKITQAFDQGSLMKLGLFLFFTGWAIGAWDDIKVQKFVYSLDPAEGKIGIKEWSGIILFILVFVALFFTHDKPIFFQSILLALILTNMWTYSDVILKRSSDMLLASRDYYTEERDNISLFKLYSAHEYLYGSWQRRRFYTLLMLAILQLISAILVEKSGLNTIFSGIQIKGVRGDTIFAYLPAGLFVLYVITSELWMKIYRFRIFSEFRALDQMRMHFTVSKKKGAEALAFNIDNLFKRSIGMHGNYN